MFAGSLLAGCSSTSTVQLDLEDVQGIWTMTSFDGQAVVVDVNTAATPWIEIDGTIAGSGGCSEFTTDGFELEGTKLILGDTFSSLVACLSEDSADLMATENALATVLGEGSISVGIAGQTMTCKAGGTELSFNKSEVQPDS